MIHNERQHFESGSIATAARLRRIIARVEKNSDQSTQAVVLENLRDFAPKDIALAMSAVDAGSAARFLKNLPARRGAELMSLMPVCAQLELLGTLDESAREELVRAMPADRLADLFLSVPATAKQMMINDLAPESRSTLERLAAYPESSAGSKMTTGFIAVPASTRTEQAVGIVRAQAPNAEVLYVLYVVDSAGRLIGTVSLRELMLAQPDATMQEIMHRDPVRVLDKASDDEACALLAQYDLSAIPVVDQNERIIGVITADDAIEINRTGAVSRLTRFGGAGTAQDGEDLDYLRTPLHRILFVRFFWLVILTLFGVITSNFVATQQALLEKAIILAAFIAPIVDMGGNVGSQSATLVIRSMTLGDVSANWRDLWTILKKEFPVALSLGVIIGLLEGALAYFSKSIPLDVLAVIILSMASCTFLGGLAGVGLPFAAKRFGIDPATLSSPLITSIMDLLGVAVYFGLAVCLLSPDLFV